MDPNQEQPKFVVDCVNHRSTSTGIFEDHIRPHLDRIVNGDGNDKDSYVVSFGMEDETTRLLDGPGDGEQGNA